MHARQQPREEEGGQDGTTGVAGGAGGAGTSADGAGGAAAGTDTVDARLEEADLYDGNSSDDNLDEAEKLIKRQQDYYHLVHRITWVG